METYLFLIELRKEGCIMFNIQENIGKKCTQAKNFVKARKGKMLMTTTLVIGTIGNAMCEVDAKATINKVIDFVFLLAIAFGIFQVISGAPKIVKFFSEDERTESMTKPVVQVVLGIMLIGIKGIFTLFGLPTSI